MARKGLPQGCLLTIRLPCACTQMHLPLGSLLAGAAPALRAAVGAGGCLADAGSQTVWSQGDVNQNRGVRAVTSSSSFLWERKGAQH